ncbi:MAG TPA: pyrroline-5-carboxylate reductase [Salinisphaeraceae bacterium]|nr:pyrroline-5-carboxylate reductase [Salinisphaeraceae bacterium]
MSATGNHGKDIVFIGAGNMATSLISGLCQAGHDPAHIHAVDPSAEQRQALVQQYPVQAHADADDAAVRAAGTWVLAVKPQIMAAVARDLGARLGEHKPLIISIAAGVPLAALRQWLGHDLPLVRCMPNTPALVGAGATGLYADASVASAQRQIAEDILATASTTVWVDAEPLLDAVTATSGSGPAYYFAFMEAMQAGAEALGLDADTARTLVLQTAFGAARMALESGDDPATLRRKVTSPGGTTEQALNAFADGDLQQLVQRAMQAAAARADSLAQAMQKE